MLLIKFIKFWVGLIKTLISVFALGLLTIFLFFVMGFLLFVSALF